LHVADVINSVFSLCMHALLRAFGDILLFCRDAAEKAVVKAGARGAVRAEWAGGGVLEVSDLRRVVVVVVVRGAHGEGRVLVGVGGRTVACERKGTAGRALCEEVLGGGVSAGTRGVASARARAPSTSADSVAVRHEYP
jgi:hypothetical protein